MVFTRLFRTRKLLFGQVTDILIFQLRVAWAHYDIPMLVEGDLLKRCNKLVILAGHFSTLLCRWSRTANNIIIIISARSIYKSFLLKSVRLLELFTILYKKEEIRNLKYC